MNMKEVISREMNWGDQKLKIETGKVAKQATASTIVSYGDTVVMANVVAAKEPKPDLDFFSDDFDKINANMPDGYLSFDSKHQSFTFFRSKI